MIKQGVRIGFGGRAAPAATGATTAGGAGRGSGQAGIRAAEGAVSAQVARCVNPFRNTAFSFSRDACVHSWFQDASGVHVNDVRNEVQWNPSSLRDEEHFGITGGHIHHVDNTVA